MVSNCSGIEDNTLLENFNFNGQQIRAYGGQWTPSTEISKIPSITNSGFNTP